MDTENYGKTIMDGIWKREVNKMVTKPSPYSDQIALGEVYEYVCGIPMGCVGELYRPHRVILDVPSYQYKVLVEALTGNDAGLWFCCTPANFSRRYRLHEPEAT